MSWHRTRLILAAHVVVVLVAAACGGDEDSDQADDAPPATFVASAQEPPPDGGEDDISTEGTEFVQVQLGNRFEWCADIQAVWDSYDQALKELAEVRVAHEEAQTAYVNATDELDRAEANDALDALRGSVIEAQDAHQIALEGARDQLRGVGWSRDVDTSSKEVAFERALSALREADPDNAAAFDGLQTAREAEWEAMEASQETGAAHRRTDGAVGHFRLAQDRAGFFLGDFFQPSDMDTASYDGLMEIGRTALSAGSEALKQENGFDLERQVEAWGAVLDSYEAAAEAFGEVVDSSADQDAADTANRIVQALREPTLAIFDRLVRANELHLAVQVSSAAIEARQSAEGALRAAVDAIIPNDAEHTAAYVAFRKSFQESCR